MRWTAFRTRFWGLLALGLAACSDRDPAAPGERARALEVPRASVVRAVQVSNVSVATGNSYIVAEGMAAEQIRYSDRSYTIASVPAAVEGATYLRTANNDKTAHPGSTTFLSFDVAEPVVVYVAHDDRVPRPSWLSEWTDSGLDLTDSDAESGSFSMFERRFAAGRITLGSNIAEANGPALSMYTVMVVPDELGGEAEPSPLSVTNVVVSSGRTYEVVPDGLVAGAVRYTDRSYTLQAVPASLAGQTFIRTANDDKNESPGSTAFLRFDVNQPVVVYVAHDDRLARPSWLSGWTDSGLELRDSDSFSAAFSLFRQSFPAGTVTLGSNVQSSSDGSMYTVVILPASQDTTPPSQPAGLTAQAVSGTRVDLSWSASTDNIGVTGYRLFRDGSQIATSGGTTYSDVSVSPSTSYTYTVAAVDGAGNVSPQSAPATVTTPAGTGSQVGLYDVWERSVTNGNAYSNPFDYTVIELQGTFHAPSGRTIGFFGFHDGNGSGGQTGNVWKLRFMPDETGTWTYTYTWSDGTPGGSGSFTVSDTGLPGPLRQATDRSWYFQNARGQPFHFRGYDLHIMERYAPSRSFVNELPWVLQKAREHVIDPGYNFTMLDGLIDRFGWLRDTLWDESWWADASDTKRFNVAAWRAFEQVLDLFRNNRVYVITFAGMVYQGQQYGFTDFQVFLRYWLARYAPYYNFFGWSPTWEWHEAWSSTYVAQVGQYLYDHDPWKRPLSAHDQMQDGWTTWGAYTMRQNPAQDVNDGNRRNETPNGGITSTWINRPVIGSEDIWETQNGAWGQPRNAMEVRRGAWGLMLAGIMPLYSEWHPEPPPTGGNGTAEPDMRRLFDFVYGQTSYRQWTQKNGLVGNRGGEACSGITGQEYIVFKTDGGSITIDLTEAGTVGFSVTWYDPANGVTQSGGTVTGGATRTLTSPFGGTDSVLLLKR